MNIIFDSNVIRGDFSLKGPDFDVIQDYLQKTQSSIIMPQIIWDEIIGLYKREIGLRLNKYDATKGNINIMLTDSSKHIPSLELDINKEADSYEIYLRNKLNLKTIGNFLSYNNTYLEEIAKRAINRKKPCGEDGQGFRDTLIWLTIKDYAITTLEKQIIFISNNQLDFGYKEKGGLHESLKEECAKAGINIHYFKNLEEFVKEHSKKIEHINSDWVKNNLTELEIFDLIKNKIDSEDPITLFSYIKNLTSNEVIGVKGVQKVKPSSYANILVYETIDNKLIVHCNIYCLLTVEFLESQSQKLTIGTFYNTNATIQAVASISLIIENNKILEKSINNLSYYYNF